MVGNFTNTQTLRKNAGRRARTKWGVLLLAALGGVACPSSAWGQLRSGRTERNLYADEVSAASSSRGAQPAPAVRTASGQRTAAAGREVVSTAGGSRPQPQRTAPTKTSSSQKAAPVVSSSFGEAVACDDCGTSDYDTYQPLMSHDYGATGCNDPGCGCQGYASDIAPTCSSLACGPCGNPLWALWCRTSVRAEVPLFWRRAQAPPALVTSAPNNIDSSVAGRLDQASTNILLGNRVLNDTANAGVRITLSTPLGQTDEYGLMFRYWNAGDQDDTFNFSSNQFPVLARPFRDTSVAGASTPNTQLVAYPGDSTGNISVATTSAVDGLELSLKRLLYRDRFTRIDWLYGYQHVSIEESLGISSNTTVTGNIPGLQGTTLAVRDHFATNNEFHGASYGIMSSREFACWKMESMFRLGMGNLRREVNINGSTTTTSAGVTSTQSQGLLARNTNNQPYVDDTFVVVPEVGINFAYCIRPGIDFNVGYNYLLVPKVAQASQQINDNLAVNLSDPLVGSLDPRLNFDERRYWLNSLGLGLQIRY